MASVAVPDRRQVDKGSWMGSQMKRQRTSYQLDVDAAVLAIRRFNSSATMAASEHLLDQHFATVKVALEPETMAERVVLLDGLWATQLFREPGASDCIVRNLAANASQLIELLGQLPVDALEGDPGAVVTVAATALPIILQHTPNSTEQYRQHYSFATKFFHWVTRAHFPIVDKRARTRINQLQREHQAACRVRSDTAAMNGLTYAAEYPRWIGFYSDLIAGLSPNQRDRLLRDDFDSQTQAYRIENSLLRVLDKVFYGQGGGTGLGRFED